MSLLFLTFALNQTTISAKTLAAQLMTRYNPSQNGLLPARYYAWEATGMRTTLIHYRHYTGDTQYNTALISALTTKAGSSQDSINPTTTGNDDQLWWGLAAMSATEYGLPNPSSSPTWLCLAKNVFDEVMARWDNSICGGSLRWQIAASDAVGYSYKNSISDGLAFQLAARLARYTDERINSSSNSNSSSSGDANSPYATWADTLHDWTQRVGLIDMTAAGPAHWVYDGTDSRLACGALVHDVWSYNTGVFLYGAAMRLEHSLERVEWLPRVQGFVAAVARDFAVRETLAETACEAEARARAASDTDQLAFRTLLARWLAATWVLVPETRGEIGHLLEASVAGALGSCDEQGACGMQWTVGGFDGKARDGQQVAALEITQGLLAVERPLPRKMGERVGGRREFGAF